jgi:hypothetical protein
MAWWEQDGCSKNLPGIYKERKKKEVMQNLLILATSSLHSLKKVTTHRDLHGLCVV